jgi:hypothetical protein
MNKRRGLLGTLIIGLVVLAGCSSSPSATSTSTTTSSAPNPTVAAEKGLAVAANLKLSDFPAGWTSMPQSSTSTGPHGLDAEIASCLHTNLAVLNSNSPTEASSPDFSDSNGDTVSSGVNYLATASQAQAEISVLESSKFPSCFTTAVNEVFTYEVNNPSSTGSTLPAGLTIGHATVAQMSFPSYGNQSIAYRVTVPFTYDGLSPDAYFDIVAVQMGRALAGLTFQSTITAFDSSMEEQLTSIVVGRLTQT